MNQVLHILRKDIRRRWPEIAASLALLAAFVWHEPRVWQRFERTYPNISEILLQYVSGLLVIAWIFLILRVVHDESLVGDRQFWVTRPYEWQKLLVAKVAFLLAFIHVPLFIAQVILLKEAGFGISGNSVNLLRMHVADFSMLMVVLVLAAITRGLGQAVTVAISAVIVAITLAELTSRLPGASLSPGTPVWDAVEGWLYLAVGACVIYWQYAHRRTWWSRSLLLGTAGLALVVQCVTPYNMLIQKGYPLIEESRHPVRLAFAGPEPGANKNRTSDWPVPEVPLSVPFRPSGMGGGRTVTVRGSRAVIDGPAGVHWDSGWQANGAEIWPDQTLTHVGFQMNKELFEKIKATPVKLRMTLALIEIVGTDQRDVVVGGAEFEIPGVGRCFGRANSAFIQCFNAVRRPGAIATIVGTTEACSVPPDERRAGSEKVLHAMLWAPEPDVNAGLSPVEDLQLNFMPSEPMPSPEQVRVVVCPGSVMRVEKPVVAQHWRVELESEEILLQGYQMER